MCDVDRCETCVRGAGLRGKAGQGGHQREFLFKILLSTLLVANTLCNERCSVSRLGGVRIVRALDDTIDRFKSEGLPMCSIRAARGGVTLSFSYT